MTQEVVVTRRGQTTIPQEIRKKLDIREGTRLTVEAEGGKIVFSKVPSIIDVDSEVAEEAARISHRVKVPMADALIMATARKLRVPCATDDPHFTEVKRIWV